MANQYGTPPAPPIPSPVPQGRDDQALIEWQKQVQEQIRRVVEGAPYPATPPGLK